MPYEIQQGDEGIYWAVFFADLLEPESWFRKSNGRNQELHKKIQKVYSVGNHRPYSTLWYFMYPGWNLMKPINWHLIISNQRTKQWNLNGTTKGHFTTSALSDILDCRGAKHKSYIYIYYIIYTYSDDCLLGSNPLENKKGSLRIIPFLCLASFQKVCVETCWNHQSIEIIIGYIYIYIYILVVSIPFPMI